MIDTKHVKRSFQNYISQYEDQNAPGFQLKVIHTMHVVENAREITEAMHLSEENIELAETIAYLHDIGRFDELKILKGFDSLNNDHAMYASEILFKHQLIRDFIENDKYDYIIQKAIENHNKLKIENGLTERELLHAKIIRDADKLDNYRVKIEEPIESIFPGVVKQVEEIENSKISNNVYESVLKKECVNIKDRVYPLDYWICILAFIFDINFKETIVIIKENNYINKAIDRIKYQNIESKEKMETIRKIINDYIEERLKENR